MTDSDYKDPDDNHGYKKWQCFFCGYLYDEAQGWPDDGIAPGTRWADVPDSWMCPECGATKTDFYMLEVD